MASPGRSDWGYTDFRCLFASSTCLRGAGVAAHSLARMYSTKLVAGAGVSGSSPLVGSLFRLFATFTYPTRRARPVTRCRRLGSCRTIGEGDGSKPCQGRREPANVPSCWP